MCGFIFCVPLNAKGQALIEKNFDTAFDSIAYRGPDEHKQYQVDLIKSAFHRLSIIDSQNSHQPYKDTYEDVILYFNGFISNYSELKRLFNLEAKSDTKLLLKLYLHKGISFTEDIKGMYSIIILDQRYGDVYFFRDNYGIKPMYYFLNQNIMCIGSELKALNLLTENIELDIDSVLSDSRINMNQKNSVKIKSFTKTGNIVEPGVLYTFNLRTHRLSKEVFWEFKPCAKKQEKNQIINQYRTYFNKSIKRNLLKDEYIELAIMLSGGIDSTSILSKLPRSSHCFTIKNKATELNGEISSSIKTAKFYNIKLNEVDTDVELKLIKNKAEFYKDLLWITESPLMSIEHILKFLLLKRVKEINPNIKIIFSGQGSDEFNGGYSTLPSTSEDWESFIEYLKIKDYIGNSYLRDYWNDNYSEFVQLDSEKNYYYEYLKSMYIDLVMYNCHFEDRLSSFWGLENRVPFLDYDLVDFSINLALQNQNLLYDKKILRKALEKSLPPHIINKEKTPFYFGEGEKYINSIMLEFFKDKDYQLLRDISNDINEFKKLKKALYFNFSKERTNAPFVRYVNAKLLKKMFSEKKAQPTYLKELYS